MNPELGFESRAGLFWALSPLQAALPGFRDSAPCWSKYRRWQCSKHPGLFADGIVPPTSKDALAFLGVTRDLVGIVYLRFPLTTEFTTMKVSCCL